MRVSPRPAPGPPAVAYAIGRNVGGAVERNRLRRRLRVVVRAHAPALFVGYDHLIAADAAAATLSFADIEAQITDLVATVRAKVATP
jgi:ribonuclease P protein component